jgi:hypothetical protein
MRDAWRRMSVLALGAVMVVGLGTPSVRGARPVPSARKKVLVELYTSQGCSSCPGAEKLLGRLPRLGYGPDRVVCLAFHVDYFNDPWKDPFSDPTYSSRQMAYNGAMGRKDLYFTPMMMVDGRTPMLGSDQPKAEAALERAVREKPGVALGIELAPASGSDDPRRKTLTLSVAARSAEAAGRDLLVGVAIFEDPVTTAVPSGENAGKTLVEHHAVRKFAYQKAQLGRGRPSEFRFPLELPADANPAHCGIAVFVQDWKKGQIHQADAVAWTSDSPGVDGVAGAPAAREAR